MQQKSARPQFFKKSRYQPLPQQEAIPLAPTPSPGKGSLQHIADADLEMPPRIVVRDRRRCVKVVLISKGVYGVAFVLTDSNMDAFVGEELLEYILAKKLESLLPLAVGFAGNLVPNIPWLIAILNILEKENKHKHHHHHHDGEHHHDHDHDSWGHFFQDLGLIFVPTCAVSFAAGWDTVNRLSFSVAGVAPPLALSIIMSAFAGAILGSGDFIIHRHYFHAAGGNPWQAFKTTYGENLLYRQDWGYWSPFWKALMFWIKTVNILSHFPLGYFSASVVLEVTGLDKLLPWWLTMIIPLFPAFSMTLFEAITETTRVDRLWGTPKKRPKNLSDYSIWTKLTLIFAGTVHTVPSAYICAAKTRQWIPSETPYYWAYNLGYFSLWMLILSAAIYAFYATAINRKFDDVIRTLTCNPRTAHENFELDLGTKPKSRCCGLRWFRTGESKPLLTQTPSKHFLYNDEVEDGYNSPEEEDIEAQHTPVVVPEPKSSWGCSVM